MRAAVSLIGGKICVNEHRNSEVDMRFDQLCFNFIRTFRI